VLGGKALQHDPAQPLVVHSTLGYLGGLDELIAAMRAGVTYANVHSQVSPGGEIRGQLRPGKGADGNDD